MIRQVVLATDGSEAALEAARLLARLGLPAGTPVRAVCVVDRHVESILEVVRPDERHYPDRVLAQAAAELEGSGLAVERVRLYGEPAHEVIRAARDTGADLIVVGHRGLSGLEDFVLGSVARNVAKHAPCSVLVARGPARTPQRVLIADDGSEHAERAVGLAGELFAGPGTELRLVQVVRPANPLAGLASVSDPRLYDTLRDLEAQCREQAGQELDAAAGGLRCEGREVSTKVRLGDPGQEILREAESFQADLVVVGARGASLLENLVLGSVADRVLRRAATSVLLVR